MNGRTIAIVIALPVLASCGGGGGDGNPAAPGVPGAPAAAADLSKPYLTDAKVESIAKLMKDEPEEWKKLSKGWTALTAAGAKAELDAFAKKHGFTDFFDYANTAQRVGIGMGQAALAEAQKNADKMPPEVRKMMGDQMAKSMGPQLNEADLKIIQKHMKELSAGPHGGEGDDEGPDDSGDEE